VTIRDPDVLRLLQTVMRETPAGAFLFPFSTAVYRQAFKGACAAVGLGHCGFVPHSLRHGGATHDILSGTSIEDVLLRGRWASTKSARHYVQSGRALMLDLSVPGLVLLRASLLAHSPAFHICSASHRPPPNTP
jgi:integrase